MIAAAQSGVLSFRCASSFARAIRERLEIGPVGVAVAEQHVHDGTGERAVGPRPEAQREIRLLHGAVAIDVDHDDLGASLLARLDRMRHHVDLRVDRVCPPDDEQVGSGHLTRIGPCKLAGARNEAGPRERRADRGMLPGIALGMAQAVDAVTHDEAHRSREEVRPHRLGSVPSLGRQQRLGRYVECVVPTHALELAGPLRALAAQGMEQAVGMVHTLRVARDLGADHAIRVSVGLCTSDTPNPAIVEQLDFESACRGTVVRTNRMADCNLGIHRLSSARSRDVALRRHSQGHC